MKKTIALFTFLFICRILFAQDYILKRNGEEIYGNVKEISPSEVRYTDTSNVNVIRVLSKSDVFMIRFRNGLKEVFQEDKPLEQKNIPPAIVSKKSEFDGPIMDMGSNDYNINGRIYHFSEVRRLLLSTNDEQIRKLLSQARVQGVFGNVIAYTSIPVGYIGLALAVSGLDYDGAMTATGILLSTVCIGSNVGNILLKVNKKKKIAEAIAIYNKKVEQQATNQ